MADENSEQEMNENILEENEFVLGINFGTENITASIFNCKGRNPQPIIFPSTGSEYFPGAIKYPLQKKDEESRPVSKTRKARRPESRAGRPESKAGRSSADNKMKRASPVKESEEENKPKKSKKEPQIAKLEDLMKFTDESQIENFDNLLDKEIEEPEENQEEAANPIEESEHNGKDDEMENDFLKDSEIKESEIKESMNGENKDKKNQKEEDENCLIISNIKKLIGNAYKNSQKEIQKILDENSKKLSEPIEEDEPKLLEIINGEGEEDVIKFLIRGAEYSPEDLLASYIFAPIIEAAKDKAGKNIGCLVISVPLSLNSNQRNAIINAAKMCKVRIIKIINDSIASVIGHSWNNKIQSTENFLVVDFGASKFETCLISNKGNKYFKIYSTRGDSNYNGYLFNDAIIKYCKDEFLKRGRQPKSEDKKRELIKKCEEAKKKLSENSEVKVEIKKYDENFDLNVIINRSQFEELNADYINKAKSMIDAVVAEGQVNIEKSEKRKAKSENKKAAENIPFEIKHVMLLGQVTNIPAISDYINEKFQETAEINIAEPNSISNGAAIFGALKTEATNGGRIKELKVFGMAPLSLGIRVEGDLMSTVIPRGARLPIKIRKPFVTTQDGQRIIKFEIYEGERKLISDNNFLGKIVLKDLPQKRRGEVKIDVIFEIDEDGKLTVSASDRNDDNKSVMSQLIATGNLKQEEIDQKLAEAEENKEYDLEEEERIKLMITLEKLILEKGNLFSSDEEMKRFIESYRNWLQHYPSAPKEQIQEKINELAEACKGLEDQIQSQQIPQQEEEKKEEATPAEQPPAEPQPEEKPPEEKPDDEL